MKGGDTTGGEPDDNIMYPPERVKDDKETNPKLDFNSFINVYSKFVEYKMYYKKSNTETDIFFPQDSETIKTILDIINNPDDINKDDLSKIIYDEAKIKNLLDIIKRKKELKRKIYLKDNYEYILKDIYALKSKDNGEVRVDLDGFMSHKIYKLKYKNKTQQKFYDELYEYNLEIWKLIYKNYVSGWASQIAKTEKTISPLPTRTYLLHKNSIFGEDFTYTKEQSTNPFDKMILFVCLRNFQLIVINSIYLVIDKYYKQIIDKIDIIIDELNESLTMTINNLYTKFEASIYYEPILKFSKLKYQYSNFKTYINEIYKKLICNRFQDVKTYSNYNIFMNQLIKNYLMIHNGIFYKGNLLDSKNYKSADEEKNRQIDEFILSINTKINNIDNFINELIRLECDDPTIIDKTRSLGSVLLKDENYDLALRKMFFYANLYIDEALKVLYKDMIKHYESITDENFDEILTTEIVRTPGLLLGDHTLLCNELKTKVFSDRKTKIIGLRKSADAYQSTCPEIFEASDYLNIQSPVSEFMLCYWSNIVNTFLMTKAIKDNDYVLLLLENDFISYNKYTGETNNTGRNIHRNVLKLMATKIYVGYLKFNVYNVKPQFVRDISKIEPTTLGMNIIFVFFNNYYFEFYDIYGNPIRIGGIYSQDFLTAQEMRILKNRNKDSRRAYFDITRDNTDNKHYIYWIDPKKPITPNIEEIKKKMPDVTDFFCMVPIYAKDYLGIKIQDKITEIILEEAKIISETGKETSTYEQLSKLKNWYDKLSDSEKKKVFEKPTTDIEELEKIKKILEDTFKPNIYDDKTLEFKQHSEFSSPIQGNKETNDKILKMLYDYHTKKLSSDVILRQPKEEQPKPKILDWRQKQPPKQHVSYSNMTQKIKESDEKWKSGWEKVVGKKKYNYRGGGYELYISNKQNHSNLKKLLQF